jgi:hypothetical protein
VSATRIFNGVDGAPRIVAVIPLSEDVNARATVCALSEALDTPADDCPKTGLWKLKFVVVICLHGPSGAHYSLWTAERSVLKHLYNS